MAIYAYSSYGQNEERIYKSGGETGNALLCGKEHKTYEWELSWQSHHSLKLLVSYKQSSQFAIIGHTPCHDSFGNIYVKPDVYKIHNT